jgi:HAD superfamily hydrolase (TIGR01662 family)
MAIKAVIFDIDGVLVDSFYANLKYLQDLFKKAGRKQITKRQYETEGFYRSLKDVVRMFGQCKNEKEVEEICLLSNKVKYDSGLCKYPAALNKTISKLSKSYKLAVVTSRIKRTAELALLDSKINKYFSTLVYYGQYKNPKPDPEPLLLALKRLKIKPKEAVYIGDAFTDIQAAKAAGMKMILFSKDKISGADARTTRFAELPKLIKSLRD